MESLIRILVTSFAVFILTEIAKRSSFIAAIIASSPIAAIGACLLLYFEGEPTHRIATFISQITVLLPPSLIFFIGFPLALKREMDFTIALLIFIPSMILAYVLYILALRFFGFRFF